MRWPSTLARNDRRGRSLDVANWAAHQQWRQFLVDVSQRNGFWFNRRAGNAWPVIAPVRNQQTRNFNSRVASTRLISAPARGRAESLKILAVSCGAWARLQAGDQFPTAQSKPRRQSQCFKIPAIRRKDLGALRSGRIAMAQAARKAARAPAHSGNLASISVVSNGAATTCFNNQPQMHLCPAVRPKSPRRRRTGSESAQNRQRLDCEHQLDGLSCASAAGQRAHRTITAEPKWNSAMSARRPHTTQKSQHATNHRFSGPIENTRTHALSNSPATRFIHRQRHAPKTATPHASAASSDYLPREARDRSTNSPTRALGCSLTTKSACAGDGECH